MTTRNLNRTWRDVVFQQYASDHAAGVSFPVRYLINAKQWNKDIWIEIPRKIDVQEFRRSVGRFFVERHKKDPIFDDQNISVRPRIKPDLVDDSGEQTQLEEMQQVAGEETCS